ncbi:lactadherin-like [Dendronephthya gigantea]|uniref:lactadherin-like n=1 Tax=Dendronephthya gigantea TaxID=151771 RepID=UPI00106A16E2|nr:lactadherin-like [Dendronephthya gigantea]
MGNTLLFLFASIFCMISHGEAICCGEIKSIVDKKIEAEKVLCAPGNNLPPGCCRDILKAVEEYSAAYEAICVNNTVPCIDPKPLGMQSGKIPDSAITASSTFGSSYYPYFARLNKTGSSCCWAPTAAGRVGSWLQVDLGQNTTVIGFSTQGTCYSHVEWAISYSISYSNNGGTWTLYEESGTAKVFQGNQDQNSIVNHTFKTGIKARYIRVLPKSWKNYPTMRLELYGCY